MPNAAAYRASTSGSVRPPQLPKREVAAAACLPACHPEATGPVELARARGRRGTIQTCPWQRVPVVVCVELADMLSAPTAVAIRFADDKQEVSHCASQPKKMMKCTCRAVLTWPKRRRESCCVNQGASRFRAWLIVPLRVEWEARHHVVDPTSPANSSRDRVSSLALA